MRERDSWLHNKIMYLKMSRYSCTLRGHCDEDSTGRYPSLEVCQQQCQVNTITDEDRELMFITLSYDSEQALLLAPSDQVDYLIREYGIRVGVGIADKVLLALYANDYLGLYRVGLLNYLNSEGIKVPPRALDLLDFLMLEILRPLAGLSAPNWDFLKGKGVRFCHALVGGDKTFDPAQPELSRASLRTLYRSVMLFGYSAANITEANTPIPVRNLAFMDSYAPYLFERFG